MAMKEIYTHLHIQTDTKANELVDGKKGNSNIKLAKYCSAIAMTISLTPEVTNKNTILHGTDPGASVLE